MNKKLDKKEKHAIRELKLNDFRVDYSNKLQVCLQKLSMSNTDLAKRINQTPASVGQYTVGERLPMYPFFYEICEILNVSADYFNPEVKADQYDKYSIKKHTEPKETENFTKREQYINDITLQLNTLPVKALEYLSSFFNTAFK